MCKNEVAGLLVSRGGSLFDNGGWDLGHHGGYGRKYSYSFVLTWFCLKVHKIAIVFNIKIMTTTATVCIVLLKNTGKYNKLKKIIKKYL
jgi:hypothetical protein